MKIYSKLLEIQKKVDAFVKDGKGQTYTYTTGNTVLNRIRPLMNELGLLLKQEIVEVNNVRTDYLTNSGKHKSEMFTECKFIFTWVDTETGEKDVNQWAANGMNDWDKGIGSAMTYAERYFLLKYFHVPTDADDPDARQGQDNNGNPAKVTKPQAPPQQPAPPQNNYPDDNRPWLTEEQFNQYIEVAALNPQSTWDEVSKQYRMKKIYAEAFKKLL